MTQEIIQQMKLNRMSELDLKKSRLAGHMYYDEIPMSRILMDFIQLARDQWESFCRDKAAENMGYERVYVMQLLDEIPRGIKNRMRQNMKNVEFTQMMDQMADDVDSIEDVVSDLYFNMRNAIMQCMPYRHQNIMVRGGLALVFLTFANDAVKLISHKGKDEPGDQRIELAIELIDNIPSKYKFEEWKPMENICERAWTDAVIDRLCKIAFKRDYNPAPPPQVLRSRTDVNKGLHELYKTMSATWK